MRSVACVQEASKRGYSRVLICEDDVVVAETTTVAAIEAALGVLDAERPAWHILHVVASALSAKVFSRQSAQSAWPVSLLALPGMHGRHDAELLSG